MLDNPYLKPLGVTPDAEDLALHARNSDLELITERLGELVPLLKFVGFRIAQVTAEKTVLEVPLLESAMNQNGTHQASVFYLLADYALGVAMFGVLPGIYGVGIHDRCRALPVQYWLRGGQIQHVAPGTGAIRAEVAIAPETAATMRAQLVAKGRCMLRHEVKIYQGDQLVAVTEHEMGMYADLPRAADIKATVTQVDRLKTSALMIAALRGDDVSLALAGEQGIAVAQRMVRASPQLPDLISARNTHARAHIGAEAEGFPQVLVLGAGLDSKPLTMARPNQRWYLADLRDMLRERAARIEALGIDNTHAVPVPVDLRLSDWPMKVLDAGFEPALPTLVILEGVSMYLSAEELRRTLTLVRSLCDNGRSRLWLDHVTEDLLVMDRPEVRSFLASMARLGEPFVTGFADPIAFSGGGGWSLVENATARDVLGYGDDVHSNYRFSVLEAA